MIHFKRELVLCDECDKKSGYGTLIQVTYSNSGGYHPVWEGYKCPHVSINRIIAYNVKYATSKSMEEKIAWLLDLKLTEIRDTKLVTLSAEDCRKLLEEV